MLKKLLPFLVVLVLLLPGCAFIQDIPARVKGSGIIATETRPALDFTQVSLEGSADVNISFGDFESVTVIAEDNIVSLIETNVLNHKLVIKTKPFMSFSATKSVIINVTMKTLDRVSISGSGKIDILDYAGDAFKVDLPGSGNINISGVANRIDIFVGGSGNILANNLQTKSAVVNLRGSGNVTVYASDSLDATISGSGDIQYSGNPQMVNKKITGSGNIHE